MKEELYAPEVLEALSAEELLRRLEDIAGHRHATIYEDVYPQIRAEVFQRMTTLSRVLLHRRPKPTLPLDASKWEVVLVDENPPNGEDWWLIATHVVPPTRHFPCGAACFWARRRPEASA